ncbi:FeoA family protein [Marinihelvus fidelis]|nr:FeoA family protein [Marinihelvus fidelis]
MTLAELRNGMRADITAMNASDPGIIRLMTLGLVEGVAVEFRNAAIGGDPIEVSVFGASVSVRLDQARQIEVSPLEP